MNKPTYDIIVKFISGEQLSTEETQLMNNVLNDVQYRKELLTWFEETWEGSEEANVNLQFSTLKKRIEKPGIRIQYTRLFKLFSKVAAILVLPLIIAALYFYHNQSQQAEWLCIYTNKGEQTNVILPDGSEVHLNVDSKLSYPTDFGVQNRNLKLEGEAYFDVMRNEKLAFVVSSGDIKTKALGTAFSISAYPDEDQIRSSLIHGSTEVSLGDKIRVLKPGQQIVFENDTIVVKTFEPEVEMAWKDAQLNFRLTPFDEVVTKLEKWYDIDINYNREELEDETLTVRFQKDETLEHVLSIMSKAIGFKYNINDKNVEVTK